MSGKKEVMFTVMMSVEFYNRMKDIASLFGISMSQMARDAIEADMDVREADLSSKINQAKKDYQKVDKSFMDAFIDIVSDRVSQRMNNSNEEPKL